MILTEEYFIKRKFKFEDGVYTREEFGNDEVLFWNKSARGLILGEILVVLLGESRIHKTRGRIHHRVRHTTPTNLRLESRGSLGVS